MSNQHLSLCLAVTTLAWASAEHRPLAAAFAVGQERRPIPQRSVANGHQADSVVIDITNTMPHAMTLAYGAAGQQKDLGTIAAQSERQVTVRDLHGDSVTVWATNMIPPHEFSHTFPIHTSSHLSWQL